MLNGLRLRCWRRMSGDAALDGSQEGHPAIATGLAMLDANRG